MAPEQEAGQRRAGCGSDAPAASGERRPPDGFHRQVGPLWDFLAVADPPVRSDVIFVFGSQALAVPARAADLFRAGHAPVVLVSGRFGRMTRAAAVSPKASA